MFHLTNYQCGERQNKQNSNSFIHTYIYTYTDQLNWHKNLPTNTHIVEKDRKTIRIFELIISKQILVHLTANRDEQPYGY